MAMGLPVVQRRWAGEIMLALGDASTDGMRFNHMLFTLKRTEWYSGPAGDRHVVVHISDRVLSERLRDLEDAGFVKRKVDTERGVKVSYALTEKALPYLAPLRALAVLA